jgi:uncharacterized protein YggU (UPF0235/DUF167 family)
VLAKAYGVPRRAVTIVGGAHVRTKRVRLEGLDASAGALEPAAPSAAAAPPTRPPRRTPRR